MAAGFSQRATSALGCECGLCAWCGSLGEREGERGGGVCACDDDDETGGERWRGEVGGKADGQDSAPTPPLSPPPHSPSRQRPQRTDDGPDHAQDGSSHGAFVCVGSRVEKGRRGRGRGEGTGLTNKKNANLATPALRAFFHSLLPLSLHAPPGDCAHHPLPCCTCICVLAFSLHHATQKERERERERDLDKKEQHSYAPLPAPARRAARRRRAPPARPPARRCAAGPGRARLQEGRTCEWPATP